MPPEPRLQVREGGAAIPEQYLAVRDACRVQYVGMTPEALAFEAAVNSRAALVALAGLEPRVSALEHQASWTRGALWTLVVLVPVALAFLAFFRVPS